MLPVAMAYRRSPKVFFVRVATNPTKPAVMVSVAVPQIMTELHIFVDRQRNVRQIIIMWTRASGGGGGRCAP